MTGLPILDEALALLAGMDGATAIAFFWFTVFCELPRYALSFPAVVMLAIAERRRPPAPVISPHGLVSVIIPGHNEADCIERCVRSLRRQTLQGFEIVCVSDGSSDATYAIMRKLHAEGLIDRVAECQTRGGKPSALNLAARLATGRILVVVDCDCSFPDGALAEIVAPFSDPAIGAVAGRVLVRNPGASIVTGLQAVEYFIGMTLGRAQMAMLGQLSLVSGAFGAFRREAWDQVGGMDPGPGEDFDFCLRIRKRGWQVGFAMRAVCWTDVPESLAALLRQRKRWERDALWIRLRKHGSALNPFSGEFRAREVPHHLDFLLLTVLPTIVLPIFVVGLMSQHGMQGAIVILLAASIGLFALDLFVLACAIWSHGDRSQWRLALWLPLHGLFQAYVLRLARLKVFAEEWIWSTSREDGYCPPKVNAWANWR